MTAPSAFGGAEADSVSYGPALIELGAADGAHSTIVSIQNSLLAAGILRCGTPAQQKRFVPELNSGRMIGAFALTEADAGSDATAMRIRATHVDGGLVLNGSKRFITSGSIAELAMVFAVTDPEAGKQGISAFLVPTNLPGYFVERTEHKLGQAAFDTCVLRFEDLFVEEALLLDDAGAGYRMALSNLEIGRIGIAAQSVGMAQAALEIATASAKDRRSMGKVIADHQTVGFRLADLATSLEASRHLTLHPASLNDAARPKLPWPSSSRRRPPSRSARAPSRYWGATVISMTSALLKSTGCARLPDLRGHVRHPKHGHSTLSLSAHEENECA